MIAVEIDSPGPEGALRPVERPTPAPGSGEVLIRVEAAGLNRGDIMQRLGRYPPPPGASDIPGLEVAGRIEAVAADVAEWRPGDRVCAILAGGGYAEYAVAPAVQCLPLPGEISMVEGAALPETLLTCWTNLVEDGRLQAGETVLIHGGASGIGVTGIQLVRALGGRVFVTAGSAEKCAACRDLGAELAVNYRETDFVTAVSAATGGRGVDIVLDMVGADYVGRSLEALAYGGRYVVIGVMKGLDANISVGHLIGKRVTMSGSTLRGRSVAEKGRLRDAVRTGIWPKVESGELKGVVWRTVPLEAAADAHRALEAGDHVGKIILTTRHLSASAPT